MDGWGAAAGVDRRCLDASISAGVLACLDGYMNIAMEQTEEYVNGQLKNKYGDCFIRGNNGRWRASCRGAVCLHYLPACHATALAPVCWSHPIPSGQKFL